MALIRKTLAIFIFILSNPLSWYLAWEASRSIMYAAFTIFMPTMGAFYWLLENMFGNFFGQGGAAFALGFLGAGASLVLMRMLWGDS
jgi:hypothetical protein